MLDRLILRLLNRPQVRRCLAQIRLAEPVVFGPEERLHVHPSAIVNNALFNTISGMIQVHEDVFFGHNVCLLTGTHDYGVRGKERVNSVPAEGNEIIVEEGAWLASNVTVLGPARIGHHAVVAAAAVVRTDVAPYTLVAGVPATLVRELEKP